MVEVAAEVVVVVMELNLPWRKQKFNFKVFFIFTRSFTRFCSSMRLCIELGTILNDRQLTDVYAGR